MKCFLINYRNFKDTYAGFSYYQNRNICLEIYSESIRLCELSKQLDFGISCEMVVLKDLLHTEELIKEMVNADLISAYNFISSAYGKVYVCRLSNTVIYELSNVAMAATV